mgnify:CR=1 FL=1
MNPSTTSRKIAALLLIASMLLSSSVALAKETCYAYHNGVRICTSGDDFYLQDSSGQTISDKFDFISPRFHNGVTTYKENNLFGLMNTSGEIIIDAKFAKIGQLDEDLIPASEDGQHFGYINIKGEFVIEPQWNEAAYPFVEGQAVVRSYSSQGSTTSIIDKDGHVLFSSTTINRVINAIRPGFCFSTYTDSGECYFVWTPDNEMVSIDQENGYDEGTLRISGDSNFSEGLLPIYVHPVDRTYGYINRWGKIVVEPNYEDVTEFSNGYAYAAKEYLSTSDYRETEPDELGRIWATLPTVDVLDSNGDVVGTQALHCKDLYLKWEYGCGYGGALPLFDYRGSYSEGKKTAWDAMVYDKSLEGEKDRYRTTTTWESKRQVDEKIGIYEKIITKVSQDEGIEISDAGGIALYNIATDQIIFEITFNSDEFYYFDCLPVDGLYSVYDQNGRIAFITDTGELACPYQYANEYGN